MIAWLLFLILAALSLRCFMWGLSKPDRLYQFPTLFGAAWLFYMVPQILGSVRNPEKYPQAVLSDGGLELALLMCIACIQAAWSGYFRTKVGRPAVTKRPSRLQYSDARIFLAGILLYAIGFLGAYLLASLAGGFIQQFTEGGHYSLEWSGMPVIYVFLAQLIYPGLLFVYLAYLHRPTLIRAGVALLFSLYPIATTLFLGRRAMTLQLLLIALLGLFFIKRWAPPRPLVIIGVAAMAFFVVIAPQYRTVAQYGLNAEALREIEVQSTFDDIVSGSTYAEFDSLVVSAAAVSSELTFGYGASFYNAVIAQLVPRQFVGEGFKNSLMIELPPLITDPGRMYSWTLPYGSNPTGVANAISEFWFLGAFIYYFLAAAIRKLWESASHEASLASQIWYVTFSLLIPVSVIGSLYILPGQILAIYIFLAPLLWFARARPSRRTKGLA
jgi:hypothetical protein